MALKKLYSLEELKNELEPNPSTNNNSLQIPDNVIVDFINNNERIKLITEKGHSNMDEAYSVEDNEKVKIQWQKHKSTLGLGPRIFSIEELRKELEPRFFSNESPWRIPDDVMSDFIRHNKEIKTISKDHYSFSDEAMEKIKSQWQEHKSKNGLEPKSVSIDYMLDMLEPNISTHTNNLKEALFSFIRTRKNIWSTLESNGSYQYFTNIVIKDKDIPSIQRDWSLYKQQNLIQPPASNFHYSLEQIMGLLEPEHSKAIRNKHSVREAIESFLINLDIGEKKIRFDNTSNKYVLPDVNKLKSMWDNYKKERWVQNQYTFNEIVDFLEPCGLDPNLLEKDLLESIEKFIHIKSKEKSNSDVTGLTKKITPSDTTYFSITNTDLHDIYEDWQSYKKEVIHDYEKRSCSFEELINLLNPSDSESQQEAILFTSNFVSNYKDRGEITEVKKNNKYVMVNRDKTISDLIGSWKEYEQQKGLKPVVETSKSYRTAPFIMDFKRYSRLELIDTLEANKEDFRSRRHAMKIVDKFLSTSSLVRYDSGNGEVMISEDAMSKLRSEWNFAKVRKSRSRDNAKLDKLYTYKRVDTPYKFKLFRIRQSVKIKKTDHDAEEKFLSAVANGYKINIKSDYIPPLEVLSKAQQIIDGIRLNYGEVETIHLPRRPFFGKDKFLETRFQAYSLGLIDPFKNFKIKPGQMPEYTDAFKEYTDIVTKRYGENPTIKVNGPALYSQGLQSIEYGRDNDMLPRHTFTYHVNPITKTAHTISPPELGVRKAKAEIRKFTLMQQNQNKISLKIGQWLQESMQLGKKALRQDQLRLTNHVHGR